MQHSTQKKKVQGNSRLPLTDATGRSRAQLITAGNVQDLEEARSLLAMGLSAQDGFSPIALMMPEA